jgi:hypothetical protein
MSEAALLRLILRYPHPVAIARRVGGTTMHIGVRRLQELGLVTERGGLYRVTRRGRDALRFEVSLRISILHAA